MATTITGSTNSSYWTFKLVVTENSTNASANTSSVTVEAFIGRGSSAGASYMQGASISCPISVTGCSNQTITYSNSGTVNVAQGAWLSIGSKTFASVPHDSDGSKTITVSASFTNNVSPSSGSASGSVTLTKITQSAQTYIIKYDANGGTGAPASQTKTHGVDLVMTTAVPTRTGYTFKCWNTAKDGSGYDRDPGGYVYGDADLTWYAQWTANVLTIYYHVNGGSINSSNYYVKSSDNLIYFTSNTSVIVSDKYTYNDKRSTGLYNASTLGLYKDNYTFTGWKVGSTGTTVFSPGNTSYVSTDFTNSIKTSNCTITLYAVWEKATVTQCTATFDANGGSTPSPQTITVNSGSALGTLPTTYRTGYTFFGWFTAKTGGTRVTTTTTITSNVTYYAQWTAYTYTLTYDANGGTGAPSSQTWTHDDASIKLSSTKPTRTNYTFLGWAETSTATSAAYSAGATISSNKWAQNTTLYAVWKSSGSPTTYTITFNGNGGTANPSSMSVTAGSSLGSLPTATRSGYTLDGWYTSASGGTKISASTVPTGNTTYYAHWTEIPATTYNISYVLNGGTAGSSAPTSAEVGSWFSVSNPTRSNATFNGWDISGMDSSTHYYGTSTYYGYSTSTATSLSGIKVTNFKNLRESSGTVTFTAKWNVQTYTATFDANGGSTANPSTITKESGQQLGTLPTTSRDGYDFNGWFTAKTGGTQISSTTTISSNVTYYAQWTIKTYTVSYNAKNGTGAPASQTKTHGVDLTLSSTVPTRTNYTFKGWSTSSWATTVNYNPGDKYTANASVTLYAVWEAIVSCTATFNANGGSTANPSTITVNSGDALGTLPTTSRDGYTFDGWYTSASGGTKISSSTTITSNVTYYAHWTAITYTVSYNANGGSGAPSSQTKTHGTDLTLSSTKPTRTNYTFKGWGTSSTDTTVDYAAGATYSANASITLYAIWESYKTATFDSNGGSTANPSTITVPSGSALGTLPTTSRTGYSFDGWYTSKTSGTKISSTTTITSNVTYYAHWTANTYTVSYNANGGSGAPSSQTKTHDVNLTLSSTIPTRTNYVFKGWGTSASDTSVDYAAGATYTTNASITLYAIWEAYKVATFDSNGGSTANPSTISVPSGSALGTLPTTSRTGYDFNGWYTAKTGGTKITASTTITSNVTYYAQWTAHTYTISYNANGGSGAPSSQTKTHDVNLTLSSTKPTRSGYIFNGWGTSASDTSVDYAAGATYSSNASITLYAIWSQRGEQRVYIYDNGKVYARAYLTASSIYIGSDGTFYAPAFTTGTSFSIGSSGVIAVQFIEGEP